MSSKINSLDNRPVQMHGRDATERTAGKSAAAPGAAVSQAAHDVKLTGSAVQLAALEKALAQVPDVDLKRVEEVRVAIQSGEYKIDAQRIAAKLLQLERALAAAELGQPE
jgi:negative regulator of flagellin synthesis FlgM